MSNPEFQPSEAHHLDLAIIDDNPADTRLLCRLLDRLPGWEFDYKTYISAADAEAGFADDMPDIVIVDYLLGDETGIDIIKRFIEQEISAVLIFLTGQGDETIAIESMRAGAAD